jgi:hypothetical protein
MHDLIGFLGVLGTAVLLVCVGHVAPADIAVIAAGLGTLLAARENRDRHNDDSGTRSRKADDKRR